MPDRIPYLDESESALQALAHASVLFTDLDGTLLAPGGTLLGDAAGNPSLAAAAAVVACNRAGIATVISTGRNRQQCGEISRMLGWRAFIAELGCIVVCDRSEPPLYLLGDWPEDAVRPGETPYQAIVRVGALDVLTGEFPGRIEPHAPWHLEREVTHVLRGNVDRERAQAALDDLELAVDIIDNGIINPPKHTLIGVSEVHAYHLVPRGTAKTRAIALVMERRGIARADALAIGDSATDVAMADAVSLGVLVNNALGDERVLAEAVTRPNVVATRRARGDGWAELAHTWLAVRSG